METLRTDRKTDGGEKERGRRKKDGAYEGRRRREEVELVLEWNEETAEGGGSESRVSPRLGPHVRRVASGTTRFADVRAVRLLNRASRFPKFEKLCSP